MELAQALDSNRFGTWISVFEGEAVTSYIEGRKDTFVSLPTGFGKSLIYGVLPSIFDKLKGEHLRQFILVLH